MKHVWSLTIMFPLLAALVSPARAQVVLIVNDANPAHVTFTATAADAGLADSTTNQDDGVDLLSFFTSNPGKTGSIEVGLLGGQNNLVPAGTATPYGSWAIDNFSVNNYALNIYIAIANTQAFTTSAPAFTGNMGGPMSDLTSFLPANGASGSVLAGYSGHPGAIVGSWEVVNTVPEPADFGWAAGLAGLAAFGWRKRRLNSPLLRTSPSALR